MNLFKNKIVVFLLLLLFFISHLWAWKGSQSRGGGRVASFNSSRSTKSSGSFSRPTSRSSSITKSSQYSSGSRSSPVNIHLLHNRNVATLPEPKYNSRSEALDAFRSSQEFQKWTTTKFSQEPTQKPDYIPSVIKKENQNYAVSFQNGTYGYFEKNTFIPLQPRDYIIHDYILRQNLFNYRGMVTESSSNQNSNSSEESGFGWLLGFLILFGGVAFIIHIISHNSVKRKNMVVDYVEQSSSNTISEKDFEFLKDSNSPSPHKKSTHDDPNSAQSVLAQRIRNLLRGKIVTLSDRLTLENFNHPLDFTVIQSSRYYHSTFSMQHIILENNSQEERLELHLFCKEVQGHFALYLGMLDHEGTDKKLRQNEWYHLKDNGDAFSEFFAGIFDTKQGEKKVVFGQFEFGGFYDITCSGNNQTLALCEYFPEDAPQDFDWQHSIVIWNKNWLYCYYCIEIHDRNIVIY